MSMSMSMSMFHVHVHVPCSMSMSMSMFHVPGEIWGAFPTASWADLGPLVPGTR